MLCKASHCAGRVSANTRPHQLHWGDWEMGTAYILYNHPPLPSANVPTSECPLETKSRYTWTKVGKITWPSADLCTLSPSLMKRSSLSGEGVTQTNSILAIMESNCFKLVLRPCLSLTRVLMQQRYEVRSVCALTHYTLSFIF